MGLNAVQERDEVAGKTIGINGFSEHDASAPVSNKVVTVCKANKAATKLPSLVSDVARSIPVPDLTLDCQFKKEFQSTPVAHPDPIVLRRVGDLEDKVNILYTKPVQMPVEKEELLNAAVFRVDALEAELNTMKKALHESLMRQEELLAYIDAK